MLPLQGVETFIAIVESGSMSAAARRLDLSKSVVSHRLAVLEKALGCRLLQRSTRKLGLTDEGQQFLERCGPLLEELRDVVESLSARQTGLHGKMRVAGPMGFGVRHLGPALYPFLAAHPDIELTLDLNDRLVDLVAEGYDMAVRIGQLADSSLIARKLADSPRVVVCSPEYARRYPLPRRLEDLPAHQAVSYSNRRSSDDWRFVRDGHAVSVPMRSRFHVNNGDVQRDAAIAGLGIALIPTFLVHDAVTAGQLIAIPLDASPIPDAVYAIYPQNRHLAAKVRALTEHLRRSFGDPPYWAL